MDIQPDYNYKLYKLLFNNIVISKHIYSFVKTNNINGKYGEITISLLVGKNNFIELLKDKLRVGSEIKNISAIDYSGCKLSVFLEKLMNHYLGNNDNINGQKEYEITLIKFYQIHRDQILHCCFRNNEDLLKILVERGCLILLKLIYQDYLLINKQCNGNEIKIFKRISSINFKNSHSRILELILSRGNIEIIKFFIDGIKLDLNCDYFKNKALYWAIQSVNRDEVVEFLITKVPGFKLPTKYSGVVGPFFQNFSLLDFKLFKIIVENNTNIFYSDNEIFGYYNIVPYIDIINNNQNQQPSQIIGRKVPIPFKKLLDFIQVSIYISSINDKLNHFHNLQTLLARIDNLLLFNEINEQDRKTLINQSNISITTNLTSNTEIYSNIFSFLTSSFINQNNNSTSINYNHPFLKESSKTNFDNFNLEREIRRIYIFDFLLCVKEKPVDINIIAKFLITFSSVYKEYQKILDFKSFNYNPKENSDIIIVKTSLYVALKYADYELLEFINNNFTISKIINQIQSEKFYSKDSFTYSKFFNCSIIPINQQIQFLTTILKLNLNYPFDNQFIINHIIKENKENHDLLEITINKLKNNNNKYK